jgi:hypothetical protein
VSGILRRESFTKKDVAQVSAAVAAHDLGSFSVSVEMSFYCSFDFVIKLGQPQWLLNLCVALYSGALH